VAADEIQSMLVRLQSSPQDVELRTRAAEFLDRQGKFDDAVLVLGPLVNVAGHEDDASLPCLCKTCLPKAGRAAEAGGLSFTRSFAVAGTRVLHFWQLADQDRQAVRASVATALVARLAKRPST
jgi:hypothetical protein